ncbi:hypothetical protein HPB50_000802 [Hyalomma asiaticum]|uniref:Uncharacterized protein n=1 Tax=Hyalomma asiaticum TaxID=266040 RepID=A0ACB7T9W7_HYAAI|nr:hypothetical protein HPB50_000802 [Hyalomma asiaticum]
MKIFHDSNRHLCATKTKDLIARRYWWPSISGDVESYVQSCHSCQAINARTKRSEECLNPRDVSNEPNTIILLDHIGPLNEMEDKGYVLVCIDHATRKLLSQAQNWKRILADAVFAINVAKSKQTGYSAFWLLHSYQPKLPGELNIGAIQSDIGESERLRSLAVARSEAKEKLKASQEYSIKRYSAKRDPPSLKVGDKVLCAIGPRRWTLDPRFEGPYESIGFLGENIALIRRTTALGSDGNKAVNIEQLCLYHERGDATAELADTSIGLQLGRGAEDSSI